MLPIRATFATKIVCVHTFATFRPSLPQSRYKNLGYRYYRPQVAGRQTGAIPGYIKRYLSNRICWNCKKQVLATQYFCECGKIQPLPDEVNYFTLLGYTDYATQIDANELSERMRTAQRHLHPDKFSRAPSYEQSLAANASSVINKAYATLSTPETRFEYILSLYYPIETDCDTQDSQFLMEILELNEDVENLLSELGKDSGLSDTALELEKRVISTFRQISRRSGEEEEQTAACLSEGKWSDARMHLSRYRYFLRVLDQLHENEKAWKILMESSVTDKRV